MAFAFPEKSLTEIEKLWKRSKMEGRGVHCNLVKTEGVAVGA